MASALWKISINDGPAVTLASLGIRGAQRTLRSFAPDEFSFVMPRADLFATAPLVYRDKVSLLRNGVFIFVGLVLPPVMVGSAAGELIQITCVNNYWLLERIIYKQKFTYRTGAPTYTGLAMQYSTRVTLGQDAWGNKVSSIAQVSDIQNWAAINGSGIVVEPSASTFVFPPLSEARDISCAAALARMMEYTPDAMSYFIYTPGYGIMSILRRAELTTATVDLADANRVAQVSLRRRQDLEVRGVYFTYITGVRATSGELIPVPVVQTAGATSGDGIIASTITLSGQGTDRAETIFSDLAAQYYASLNYEMWEGEVQIMEEECGAGFFTGMKLNLTNGYAPWATMGAMIQEIVEDLDHGITTLRLGLPGHLSGNDFFDLMTRWRERKDGAGWGASQHNGDPGVPPDDGGDGPNPDPDHGGPGGDGPGSTGPNPAAGSATSGPTGGLTAGQSFPLQVCEDGATKTRMVSGG